MTTTPVLSLKKPDASDAVKRADFNYNWDKLDAHTHDLSTQTGVTAIANGGTGGDNAAAARANIGADDATNLTRRIQTSMQAGIPAQMQGCERHQTVESADSTNGVPHGHKNIRGDASEKIIKISEAVLSDTETKSIYQVSKREIVVRSIFDTQTPYSELLYAIVKTKMKDYSTREPEVLQIHV